jgi:hypothetical protein
MIHTDHRRINLRLRHAVLLLLPAAIFLTGCAGIARRFAHGSDLTLRSLATEGASLRGNFATGVYRFEDDSHATLILLDGPEDNPAQAVIIRVFWRPMAARTPIDSDATNASIQYVVFGGAKRELVGVYAGAGYVYPHDDLGDQALSAGVWQADLLLGDCTEGFKDLLGPAALEGRLKVQRDDAQAMRLLRQLGVIVSRKLGYPRLVLHAQPASPG